MFVDELMHKGELTVPMLTTDAVWFGVTYKEDKPFAVSYTHLWRGLSGRHRRDRRCRRSLLIFKAKNAGGRPFGGRPLLFTDGS